MNDISQTKRSAEEGKTLMAGEQAKRLVAEGKAMLEGDLRGGLGRLRQALALAPDYPDLEDEIFLREDAINKLDSLLDYIVVLLKDRKDYQACQLLKDLPANYVITDRATMVGDLTSRIARAEALIEEARVLPKSGGSPALRFLEEAMGLVPDYPGLQEEVAAVRGAYSRYQVYIESLDGAIREGNLGKAEELLRAFRDVYQNDSNVSRFEVAILNRRKASQGKENLKKNLRTISMFAAVLGVVGGGYFGYESWLLNDAGKEWEQVSRLLNEKKYSEVQKSGGAIIAKLGKVRIFGGARKEEIATKLNQILQSETVKQGAVGRVMVDGVFVQVGDVDKVHSVKALMSEGAKLSAAADYLGAISKLEEGLGLSGGLEAGLAAQYGAELKASLRVAQEAAVQQKIEESRNLKSSGNFDGAVAKLNEASQMSAQYGLSAEVTGQAREGAYQEIEVGRYRDMVAAGDKKLAGGRFAEAIGAYEQALAFAQSKKLGNGTSDAKVKGSIAQAKMGILVGKGDDYAKRSRWADAVSSYSAAVKLHGESGLKSDLPVYRQGLEGLDKVQRVATLDELRSGEREAQKYMTAGEWAKARKSYERQLSLVDKSAYAAEPEIAAFRKNSLARQTELDEKIFLADKKDYLLGRHRALFKQAFGLGAEAALLDPTAVLLGSDGDNLKYSLVARSFEGKAGGGVMTFYEVIYSFNRKSGSWTMLEKKSGRKASGG